MDCDIESSCLALQKNYEETWIKGVKHFIKASKFQKHEIGQALIINSWRCSIQRNCLLGWSENCPPTPPLSQHFALSEKLALMFA